MYFDIPNLVVKNVLTDEEIKQIYLSLENSSGNAFVEVHSQLNNFIQLPDSIIEKFTNYAREITNNAKLVLTEYCHARYSNVTSDCGKLFKPALVPHVDETFQKPRFTFDYQLNGNIDWPIIVEGKFLTLKNNEAATFSGTHQIHWRQPLEFSDNQYIEMIFCHFTDPDEKDVTQTDIDKIKEEVTHYRKQFFIDGGFLNG